MAAWASRTWAFDSANFLPPLRPRARADQVLGSLKGAALCCRARGTDRYDQLVILASSSRSATSPGRLTHISVSVEQTEYCPLRLSRVRTLARILATGRDVAGETTARRARPACHERRPRAGAPAARGELLSPIRAAERGPSVPSRHNLRPRTWVTARNHRRITAPHTRTFNHGAALVVRHVIIFGYGHGLQRAIIDESQHRTPERLVMAQH